MDWNTENVSPNILWYYMSSDLQSSTVLTTSGCYPIYDKLKPSQNLKQSLPDSYMIVYTYYVMYYGTSGVA